MKKEEYQSPEVRCFAVRYREHILQSSSLSNTFNGEGFNLEDGGIG